MQWESIVSIRVESLIIQMNGGAWPSSTAEWEEVAKHFDATIHYLPGLPLERSCWVENTVFVPVLPPRSKKLMAVLSHEMTEVCCCWEGTTPYNYPPESYPCAQAARHEIALRVEQANVAL